jgi:hypothetical protein
MTRSTVSRTGSNMTPTLDPLAGVGKERKAVEFPAWVIRAGKRLGYEPATVYGRVFDEDRSWFHAVAVVVQEMLSDDKEALADRRLLELDLTRAGIDPCTAEHQAVTRDHLRIDAQQDVAFGEHLLDMTAQTYPAARRQTMEQVRAGIRWVKTSDKRFGQ